MSQLIRLDGSMPPGGYRFQDGRTGKLWDDMHTSFRERVREIIAHRKSNERVYPASEPQFLSVANVTTELSEYTCWRLGGDPEWCYSGNLNEPAPGPSVYTGKTCVCGSVDWEEIVCKTCGGRKVTGYRCKNCRAEVKP